MGEDSLCILERALSSHHPRKLSGLGNLSSHTGCLWAALEEATRNGH
ncbi:hypothetical protein LEMLEM_LOCUS10751 [Lemmus lemmus]